MKPIIFHNHILADLDEALSQIFHSNRPADRVVDYYLKNRKKWGSRDRKFFAAAVYETVRWRRRNSYLLGLETSPQNLQESTEEASEESFLNLRKLWLSGQIFEGKAIPEGFEELQKQVELRSSEFRAENLSAASRAIKNSIPDWLDELGVQELPERWDRLLPLLNQEATVDLRVNILKSTLVQVQKMLSEEGVETTSIPGCPFGLQLSLRKNVQNFESYKAGFFEVQDRSSQQVAPFVFGSVSGSVSGKAHFAPGMLVLDACAGAGGKTLHLAALMENRGNIVSADVNPKKLERLKERCKKAGVTSVQVELLNEEQIFNEPDSVRPTWIEKFDRVLLDVPCSSLGTLRRDPDLKWKSSLENINRTIELQRQIFLSYSRFVKPGGRLIYATCSFLPLENRRQVNWFLERQPDFQLEEDLNLGPDLNGGDGFYVARLLKNSSL